LFAADKLPITLFGLFYPLLEIKMTTQTNKQLSVLASSTIAFTICFAVWMMFAVIGIPIKKTLGLNETEFGLLIAMPVLTGSLIRLPLGMWTDRFGGRLVFFILMLSTVIPIYLISYATLYWHFLLLGLFVGAAGGSFSVGIAYVAKGTKVPPWVFSAPAMPVRR